MVFPPGNDCVARLAAVSFCVACSGAFLNSMKTAGVAATTNFVQGIAQGQKVDAPADREPHRIEPMRSVERRGFGHLFEEAVDCAQEIAQG